MKKKPTVLLILDGYGLNDSIEGNAIYAANTPTMDHLMKTCPFVEGNASGLAVGLPEGQMGNSEVGHLNMGAGRIVFQELTRISKEIREGDFFNNEALNYGMDQALKNDSTLHIWGLLSDGGVHSHTEHLYGLLELAARKQLKKVAVHCFLDGRDTPPSSGKNFVAELVQKMEEIGVGKIASVSGRYYAMDRDNRWDRVEKAYRVLANGQGETATNPVDAVEESYNQGLTDEFMLPTVILENGEPVATVKDNDSVIFFNYRPDRAREISRTFCMDEFTGFERGPRIKTTYVCFTDYDDKIPNKEVAFHKVELTNTFGEFLAANQMNQARIAETEKYAHVTFFFNYRPDRAREISRTFCMDEFTGFERGPRIKTTYVCFTNYDDKIPNKEVAFHKVELTNTFGEFLAANQMNQARIAETEKYAHVTFFFNGGIETPNPLEDRILVDSPKVATYDMKPTMSLFEVCEKLVEAIHSGKYDMIICNFANPDMVGHTGVFEACVAAIEAIDCCLKKAVEAVEGENGTMFICADHGNAEQLIDPVTKEVFTAHTTNPVPFILVGGPENVTLRNGGCLADIAPTLIELLGKEQPKEMTGQSLLVH